MHDRAIAWIDERMVRLEIATDITDRKKAEQTLVRQTRALKVWGECSQAISSAGDVSSLLAEVCRIVVESGQYRLAWFGRAEQDARKTVQPVAQYGYGKDYLASLEITWGDGPPSQGPTGTALRTAQPVVVRNIMTDPLFEPWRDQAIKRGFQSSIALPVCIEGSVYGALNVYAIEPDAFGEKEQKLLREVTGNLAYGIATLQAREDRQRVEEQLALIVDSLPIVPYAREAKGDRPFRYIGAAISRLTGYHAESFLADPHFWLSNIHPDDQGLAVPDLQELAGQGTSKCEYRFQMADGTYRWLANIRRLVKDSEGENSYIVGAWQDISEEKEVQQESELRMQQVVQADKLASLGEVVAGVAHEINNPNSFITYNIPLLEESWQAFAPIVTKYAENHPEIKQGNITLTEMAEEMVEIIHAIKTGSDRINKIVANLKDFARLEESASSKLVDLNKVVADTLTIVGAQARKYVGTLELDLADDLPQFFGHFQKLEQVMANLITNAAHAIPDKDKGRIVIRTSFNKRLNAILVEVEDNGNGMSSKDTERIFEPFFTTKRDSGGTGLGLSVSYGLVQEHNGRIAVMSRPGQGTKFTVFLPVDRRQGHLDIKPTILCVDDDPQVLGFLRLYFAGVDNMPVETTSSPDEVLAFLEDHPEVDIVLSDIKMGGMGGWQLLAKIKKKYPLLAVILISGEPEPFEGRKGGDLQPDLFIPKPLDPTTLADSITQIGRHRL